MAKKRKDQRKPRGQLDGIEFHAQRIVHHIRELPESKAQIEQAILNEALARASQLSLDPYGLTEPPAQNPESHFDFTLRTVRGVEYLDLMEIVAWKATRDRTRPTTKTSARPRLCG
jgi:hypothetical protein